MSLASMERCIDARNLVQRLACRAGGDFLLELLELEELGEDSAFRRSLARK